MFTDGGVGILKWNPHFHTRLRSYSNCELSLHAGKTGHDSLGLANTAGICGKAAREQDAQGRKNLKLSQKVIHVRALIKNSHNEPNKCTNVKITFFFGIQTVVTPTRFDPQYI